MTRDEFVDLILAYGNTAFEHGKARALKQNNEYMMLSVKRSSLVLQITKALESLPPSTWRESSERK